MHTQRTALIVLASLVAGSATFAQVNRGWSDWPTPYADAQRTSWLRTDPNISVDSMSAPGFELQWTSKLANQTRGLAGLTQGVTASGVTLFVPATLVAGSSNNLYLLDNDTGYVVWSRTFEGALPAVTAGCSGGIACRRRPRPLRRPGRRRQRRRDAATSRATAAYSASLARVYRLKRRAVALVGPRVGPRPRPCRRLPLVRLDSRVPLPLPAAARPLLRRRQARRNRVVPGAPPFRVHPTSERVDSAVRWSATLFPAMANSTWSASSRAKTCNGPCPSFRPTRTGPTPSPSGR